MLKNKKLYLFFVVILLGVAAYLTEKKEQQQTKSQIHTLDFVKENINTIQIERQINNKIDVLKFKRDQQAWLFENNEATDSDYINDLLTKMQDAEFELVPLGSEDSLEPFRLSKPLAEIKLTGPKNIILKLSERRNFEGLPYYQLSDEQKVYTSATDLTTKLMNKKIYFQKRHVFDFELSQIKSIYFKNNHINQELLKGDEMPKAKIEDFVKKIRAMTVQEYVQLNPKKINAEVINFTIKSHQQTWKMSLSLNYQDKKLYGLVNNQQMVEFDMTYWEYFANLKTSDFVKGKNDKN